MRESAGDGSSLTARRTLPPDRSDGRHGGQSFPIYLDADPEEQIWILFVILASMPFNFLMLDLPKYIVNGPIQAKGFEKADRHPALLPDPDPGARPTSTTDGFVEILHGFDLDRVWSLVVL